MSQQEVQLSLLPPPATTVDSWPRVRSRPLDRAGRNQGVYRAIGPGGDAGRARVILEEALGLLDRRLGSSRYLLGDQLTLADVRLEHDCPGSIFSSRRSA